jgi:hypothetical protein
MPVTLNLHMVPHILGNPNNAGPQTIWISQVSLSPNASLSLR